MSVYYQQGFIDKCAEYGIDHEIFFEKEAERGQMLMKAIEAMKQLPQEHMARPVGTLFGQPKTVANVENMIKNTSLGTDFGLGVAPIQGFYADVLNTLRQRIAAARKSGIIPPVKGKAVAQPSVPAVSPKTQTAPVKKAPSAPATTAKSPAPLAKTGPKSTGAVSKATPKKPAGSGSDAAAGGGGAKPPTTDSKPSTGGGYLSEYGNGKAVAPDAENVVDDKGLISSDTLMQILLGTGAAGAGYTAGSVWGGRNKEEDKAASAEGSKLVSALKDYLSGVVSNPFSWEGATNPQVLGKGTTLGAGGIGIASLLRSKEEPEDMPPIPPEVLMAISQQQNRV